MSEEQNELAANIFCALADGTSWDTYTEEDEIRSAPHTDTLDVKIGDQWYRVYSKPIDEPISLDAHRDKS